VKKLDIKGLMVQNKSWESVNKKNSSVKSINPIRERKVRLF
jgi:hypothetical protein